MLSSLCRIVTLTLSETTTDSGCQTRTLFKKPKGVIDGNGIGVEHERLNIALLSDLFCAFLIASRRIEISPSAPVPRIRNASPPIVALPTFQVRHSLHSPTTKIFPSFTSPFYPDLPLSSAYTWYDFRSLTVTLGENDTGFFLGDSAPLPHTTSISAPFPLSLRLTLRSGSGVKRRPLQPVVILQLTFR